MREGEREGGEEGDLECKGMYVREEDRSEELT